MIRALLQLLFQGDNGRLVSCDEIGGSCGVSFPSLLYLNWLWSRILLLIAVPLWFSLTAASSSLSESESLELEVEQFSLSPFFRERTFQDPGRQSSSSDSLSLDDDMETEELEDEESEAGWSFDDEEEISMHSSLSLPSSSDWLVRCLVRCWRRLNLYMVVV